MISRRDIAPIACYGLLFAAVVLWAVLWSAHLNPPANFSDAHEAARTPVATVPIDLPDDQPEIRRLAKHMRIP